MIVTQTVPDHLRWQAESCAQLRQRGAEATTTAPLAWLRLEPVGDEAALRLTLWPGGTDATLATCGFHGQNVRWLGPSRRGEAGR